MRNLFLTVNVFAAVLGVFFIGGVEAKEHKQKENKISGEAYLANKIDDSDRRYPTMLKALNLIIKLQANELLEVRIVTNRNLPDNSEFNDSVVFANWSLINNANYFIGAFDEKKAHCLKAFTEPYRRNVKVYSDHLKERLSTLRKKVDFLYLETEGFDSKKPQKFEQKLLNVAKAVEPCLSDRSVILIGNLPANPKNNDAVKYFVSKGWSIVKIDYQTVLKR